MLGVKAQPDGSITMSGATQIITTHIQAKIAWALNTCVKVIFFLFYSKTSIKKTSSVTPVAVLPKRAKYHYRKKWTELSYFFN
jgi:hypothetical protein